MPKPRIRDAAELRELAAALAWDLEIFLEHGDEAPNAQSTKRLLVHYAENHARPAWQDTSIALASAAWFLVLGVSTGKGTLASASGARGTRLKRNPPSCSALELEIASGRKPDTRARGFVASPELRAKRVYNLLAEGCDKCIPPDSNKSMRGRLGSLIAQVRDQVKALLERQAKSVTGIRPLRNS